MQVGEAIAYVLIKIYHTSDKFSLTHWTKSNTASLLFLQTPEEYPNEPELATTDRLQINKFIADMRGRKLDTEDIWFKFDGTSCAISYDAAQMLKHLKDILETDEKQDHSSAIQNMECLMAYFEKMEQPIASQYNH